jgi:nucleotide-binding universal stress UspA family protein
MFIKLATGARGDTSFDPSVICSLWSPLMYQRILVPFDGSATSSRGLDEAVKLATLTGAAMRLLHVVDVLQYATGFETAAAYAGEVIPFMRQAGEATLDEGKARVEKAGVKVDTLLLDSVTTRLSDVVAEQAAQWGADLIVIGTHGRRGVGRLLLGSDAEQIVRTSSVPVLLVRAPEVAGAVTAKVPAKAGADADKAALAA